jgi:hypothetical protein
LSGAPQCGEVAPAVLARFLIYRCGGLIGGRADRHAGQTGGLA